MRQLECPTERKAVLLVSHVEVWVQKRKPPERRKELKDEESSGTESSEGDQYAAVKPVDPEQVTDYYTIVF